MNYYQILGISKDATLEEIKKAYKREALRWHPDKNGDNKEAQANFVKVSEAYQVLSDGESVPNLETKRRQYDMYGTTRMPQTSTFDPFAMFQQVFGDMMQDDPFFRHRGFGGSLFDNDSFFGSGSLFGNDSFFTSDFGSRSSFKSVQTTIINGTKTTTINENGRITTITETPDGRQTKTVSGGKEEKLLKR